MAVKLSTRMHSNRMRTARLLTVTQHALPGVLAAGVPAGGCTCQGGVPARMGTFPGNPPPVNRMTDRCKNITLPQTSFAGGNEMCVCDIYVQFKMTNYNIYIFLIFDINLLIYLFVVTWIYNNISIRMTQRRSSV